jgi:hypothetical protein
LLDQLKITTTEVARVALDPAEDDRSPERDRLLKDLETRKERLEAELSEHSAELHGQVQPVTVESVQRAFPADAALVEYAVFRPFDPRAERNGDAYGPPQPCSGMQRVCSCRRTVISISFRSKRSSTNTGTI